MKVAFKVMNIIILVTTLIPTAITVISGLVASTTELGGLAFFGTILLIIPSAVTIYMALKGLRCDYGTASKVAFFILSMDIISLVFVENRGTLILQIILLCVYIYMAKKMQKIW